MPTKREDSGGTLHELGAIYRETSGGSLTELGAIYREEADGTLTQVYSAASVPANLTVGWDGVDCSMSLSWDPDPDNAQDIYRCVDFNTNSGDCSPTVDGSVIDTVSAGVGSYTDTGPSESDGHTYCYLIRSSAGDSNDDCATPGICTT